MTVFSIFIFYFRFAGEVANNWPCCLAFFRVISFWMVYLSEGTSCMPK